MITLNTLKTIKNNGGLTLKNGNPITYKTGYQVATEGVAVDNINEVMAHIENFKGNCGLWLENGIWYIDKSHRVSTKKEALEVGRKHNQISILKWANMSLIYCQRACELFFLVLGRPVVSVAVGVLHGADPRQKLGKNRDFAQFLP